MKEGIFPFGTNNGRVTMREGMALIEPYFKGQMSESRGRY